MTSVVPSLEQRLLRQDRDRRIAAAAAQEAPFVTRRLGVLFAATPWRNYRDNPPAERLIALRARRAAAMQRASREERRRLRREIPGALELERAIVRLRRYAAQLAREAE